MKTRMGIVIGLLAVAGLCAAAFAEQGPGPEQRRPLPGGRRPGLVQHRLQAFRALMNTDEGKALRGEMRKAMEALQAERKALHEAIRKDIEGGQKPAEAFKARQDELKALLKKGILLRIEFREKVLALARENVDKAVEKMHEKLRQHAGERRQRLEGLRQRRGGEGPGPEGLEKPRRELRGRIDPPRRPFRDRPDDEM